MSKEFYGINFHNIEGYWLTSRGEVEDLISDILKDLEEFELKRYSDMIRTLKKIREKWEGKLK